MSEGLARMISMCLRYGIDISEIVKQLRSVRCPSAISKNVGCNSCPDLMGSILAEMVQAKSIETTETKCPECGTKLETMEGCIKCAVCAWSRCG